MCVCGGGGGTSVLCTLFELGLVVSDSTSTHLLWLQRDQWCGKYKLTKTGQGCRDKSGKVLLFKEVCVKNSRIGERQIREDK